MTPTQREAMEQALVKLESLCVIIDAEWGKCRDLDEIEIAGDQWQEVIALRAALAEQPAEQEPDGLPLVVAGAIFDFAGYMTTRSKVIEVGSTAEAGPVADLVKDWAKLRGLSLDDAAVLSWQEWLSTAPQPVKRVPLTDERIGAVLAAAFPNDAEPDGSWKLARYERDIFRVAEQAHGITGETE